MAPQFGPVGVGPDSRTFAHARLSISALSLLALHAQEMADVSSVYHIVHSALFFNAYACCASKLRSPVLPCMISTVCWYLPLW